MTVLVYLESRVIGPFESPEAALSWARDCPNSLFPDVDAYEHADAYGDLWTADLESPTEPPPTRHVDAATATGMYDP